VYELLSQHVFHFENTGYIFDRVQFSRKWADTMDIIFGARKILATILGTSSQGVFSREL
jgi:hypothetical protein